MSKAMKRRERRLQDLPRRFKLALWKYRDVPTWWVRFFEGVDFRVRGDTGPLYSFRFDARDLKRGVVRDLGWGTKVYGRVRAKQRGNSIILTLE